MAKHDRRKSSGQAPSSQPVTIQVPLPVLGVVNGVREAFHGLCIATGLQVLEAMMEGDREALCGPKGRHQVERPAWRGGSADSQVVLGGRQVEVPRLRVRSAEGEVTRAGRARRRHRDRGRHHGPVERPGDAWSADGPDVAVRHRRRGGVCGGPSRRSSVLAPRCNGAKYTSAGTCSAISPSGCTPRSARRCGMRGTSTRRTARRGCWSGWRGPWSVTTPARRRPSGRDSTRR